MPDYIPATLRGPAASGYGYPEGTPVAIVDFATDGSRSALCELCGERACDGRIWVSFDALVV